MTPENTKAWALRHFKGIDINDDLMITWIITRWNKENGGDLHCIPVIINKMPMCFIIIYDKHDCKATKKSFKKFKEGKFALKCKAVLFSHPEDKDIATFETVSDPFEYESC